jgi:hypothetical protein
MTSPNLSTLSEEIENEAAALERLGRQPEATEARARLESVRASIDEIQAVHREVTDPQSSAGAAVLIELDYGRRAGGPARKNDATELRRKISSALEDQGDGSYGGRVIIPETTTLMFYGDDAERMFAAMQSVLREDPICAGAKITLRQAGRHREVWLPGRVM